MPVVRMPDGTLVRFPDEMSFALLSHAVTALETVTGLSSASFTGSGPGPQLNGQKPGIMGSIKNCGKHEDQAGGNFALDPLPLKTIRKNHGHDDPK